MSFVVTSQSRRAPDASATRSAAAINADPTPAHWRATCSVRTSIDAPARIHVSTPSIAPSATTTSAGWRRASTSSPRLRDEVGVVLGQERVDRRTIRRIGRADERLDRRPVVPEDGGDPEPFDDDRRVVGDGERRVPDARPNLVDGPVPVRLVRASERRGVGIPFALVDRVLVGHVREADHGRPDVLDPGHRPLVGVEEDRDVARLVDGIAIGLVLGQQARRDHLAAAERERRQLVAERTGVGEAPARRLARVRPAVRGHFRHAALRDRAHLRPSVLGP